MAKHAFAQKKNNKKVKSKYSFIFFISVYYVFVTDCAQGKHQEVIGVRKLREGCSFF